MGSGENAEINSKLNTVITLLEQLLERDIRLNTGELVGALAVPMNDALGEISNANGRGDRATWL